MNFQVVSTAEKLKSSPAVLIGPLRCLREDLALAIPRADTPLEEISHPLLARATERFADDQTPHQRIAAIDDEVLFKVKAQRWRGAIWVEAGIPWLVAAGWREEGCVEPWTSDTSPDQDTDQTFQTPMPLAVSSLWPISGAQRLPGVRCPVSVSWQWNRTAPVPRLSL